MAIARAIKYGSKLIKKGSTGKPTRVKAGPTTRKDIQSTRNRGSVKKVNSTSNSGAKPSKPTKKITHKSTGAKPKSFSKKAILATGAAGILGYMAGKNSAKKEAPKPAAKKPAAPKKPTRKAGPSGPKMTSMKAPSTGPKPRNKDEKKKPRRPSGPSMTSFKR